MREQPAIIPAPEGSYVFTLGTSVPSTFETLNDSDGIKVAQTADLTNTQDVHFRAFIRSPKTMPGSKHWRFRWGVGATIQGWRDLRPGAAFIDMRDGVIVTGDIGGVDTIFFELVLLP